jgi:hypothetical protein
MESLEQHTQSIRSWLAHSMNALAAWRTRLTYIWVYIHSRAHIHTPFDLYDNTSGTRMGGGWPNFPSTLNKLPPTICGLQTGAALARCTICILLCVRHTRRPNLFVFRLYLFYPAILASYLCSSSGPIDFCINADGSNIFV